MPIRMTANIPIEIEIDSEYCYYCGSDCKYNKRSGEDYCKLFSVKLEGWPHGKRCRQCIDAFGLPEAKNEPEY